MKNFKFVWITQTNRFEFVWKLFWKINDELHLQFILMFVFSPCSHCDFSWTLSIVCEFFFIPFCSADNRIPSNNCQFHSFSYEIKHNFVWNRALTQFWFVFLFLLLIFKCYSSYFVTWFIFFSPIFWYDSVSVTVLTWFFSEAMFLEE